MSNYLFRQAVPSDTTHIMRIIRQAQARMRARGSNQWQHGYPGVEHIESDIAQGHGYVVCDEQKIVAYGAVVFEGEPAYGTISGAWPDEEAYVVVHRLAVAEEALGRGLAVRFLRETATLARSRSIGRFRIDTNFDNAPMLRTLERLGFRHCGEIRYDGEARLAFWKRL